MPGLVVTARVATTFDPSGALDEEAFRQHLQRFVDERIGVLLASCGSGEGGTLTRDELRRVYRIGVEVCKGRVLVCSNQPEQFTAQASIEQAQLAIEAGVDFANIYGPYGLHGYRPTDEEYLRYFDRILAEVRHPISLCPHASLGYSPKPTVLAAIANKYPQVQAIILSGIAGDAYFVELKDALVHDIDIYVRYDGAFNTLGMGAAGIDVQEANFVPATVRRYVDLYQAGRTEESLEVYADLKRLTKINERWKPSSARWIKMALKAFKLPGGEGGLREPYLMPAEHEIRLFIDAVLALDIPEVNDMARRAGIS
jgi:dihydrodipicolinate synthase/N-acetylneuraminate lyase